MRRSFGLAPRRRRATRFAQNSARWIVAVLATVVGATLLAACLAAPAPGIPFAVGGDGEAIVSWSPPPGDNTLDLVAYVVTPYIASDPQDPVRFDSTETRQHVLGLSNDVTYRFSVRGIDVAGRDTAGSPLSNAVTPAPRPFFALGGTPYGLVRLDADGSDAEALVSGNFRTPDLAPDRSWLVMALPGALGSSLVAVDADGTNLREIAAGAWQSARISSDGTQIAAIELVEAVGPVLVLMDREGGNREVIHLPNGLTNQVDWSPDGTKLVVTNSSFNLLSVYDLTTGVQQVIHPGAGVFRAPLWSPDGSLIAFRDGIDLLVIPAEGGSLRSLTSAFEARPTDFSWDGGSLLLFRAGSAIYRVGLDGSQPELVVQGFGSPAA